MSLTYNAIKEFMRSYIEALNNYSHNPRTLYRMNDYFDPELKFIWYIWNRPNIYGREQFLNRLISHPDAQENLSLEELAIDVRRKVAVALIKSKWSDKDTGKMSVTSRLSCHYHLKQNSDNTIAIKKILFFAERVSPEKQIIHNKLMTQNSK